MVYNVINWDGFKEHSLYQSTDCDKAIKFVKDSTTGHELYVEEGKIAGKSFASRIIYQRLMWAERKVWLH